MRVTSSLDFSGRFGSFLSRWGIGRMDYRVNPGLYALGEPDRDSPVLVSANYKMSFDRLRSSLAGRNAWILVLDTKGINVWCAAGKGTFGTGEIVRRVQESALDRVVSHRKLIVPQLGGPGVSAHEVRMRCGFRVVYGPARAADLPAYLDAGMKADPGMRLVRFGFPDRAVLIPVEIVTGIKYALFLAAIFLLLGGLGLEGYSLHGVRANGITAAAIILFFFISGAVFGPMLLPWIPGRAFSVKGAILGFFLAAALILFSPQELFANAWLHKAAWILIPSSIVSFTVMNFTGATTFTSLSGVLREMRFAVPFQAAAFLAGFGLWLAGLFIEGGGTP